MSKAEEMCLQSLEINKKLGRLKGMVGDYGNLGIIYQKRGKWDNSEKMYLKTLEINKKLGWLEGMASSLISLGMGSDMSRLLTFWCVFKRCASSV